MGKMSAGLLMYRFRGRQLEVLLVHPGGPYWEKKDTGAWSIPKGEYSEGEDPFETAKREFFEETGFEAKGEFRGLTTIRQGGGKVVTAWAFQGECDADTARSNTFTMEWPPGSGRQRDFPEVDRAAWFSADEAKKKILKGQVGLIDELCALLMHLDP